MKTQTNAANTTAKQTMLMHAANAFLSMKDCYDPELAKAIVQGAFCFLTRKERLTVSVVSSMTQVFPEFHQMLSEFLTFLLEGKKVHAKEVYDCTKLFMDVLNSSDIPAEIKHSVMVSFMELEAASQRYMMEKICDTIGSCINTAVRWAGIVFTAKICGNVAVNHITESNKTARTQARWNSVTPSHRQTREKYRSR